MYTAHSPCSRQDMHGQATGSTPVPQRSTTRSSWGWELLLGRRKHGGCRNKWHSGWLGNKAGVRVERTQETMVTGSLCRSWRVVQHNRGCVLKTDLCTVWVLSERIDVARYSCRSGLIVIIRRHVCKVCLTYCRLLPWPSSLKSRILHFNLCKTEAVVRSSLYPTKLCPCSAHTRSPTTSGTAIKNNLGLSILLKDTYIRCKELGSDLPNFKLMEGTLYHLHHTHWCRCCWNRCYWYYCAGLLILEKVSHKITLVWFIWYVNDSVVIV